MRKRTGKYPAGALNRREARAGRGGGARAGRGARAVTSLPKKRNEVDSRAFPGSEPWTNPRETEDMSFYSDGGRCPRTKKTHEWKDTAHSEREQTKATLFTSWRVLVTSKHVLVTSKHVQEARHGRG